MDYKDNEIISFDWTELQPRASDMDLQPTTVANVITGRNVTVKISAVLSLSGVTIPAQGSGYLTVWANVIKDNSLWRKVEISAVDLTPAGPNGEFRANKSIENVPVGSYRVSLDFTSYWKHGGRFVYSTYASIEADSVAIWAHQLVGTPGQESPTYDAKELELIVQA